MYRLRAAERRDELKSILETLGGERWLVTTPGAQRESAETMTRAFRLNLTILSLIALLVGLYLIFQALDGAVVESGAMVAAGAVVTPRKIVRSGELWAGNPAQKLRDITEKDLEMFRRVVGHYIELANAHRPVEQKAAE